MFRIWRILPSLFIVFVLYNLLALLHYFQVIPDILHHQFVSIPLPSKAIWKPTIADALVLMGMALLYFELFKATGISNREIMEHLFSFFLLLAFMLEFMLSPLGADTAFVFLMTISCIDLLAGFTITIASARRDINLGGGLR